DLPAFKRRCHVHVPPTDTNPHSLVKAVKTLDSMDLKQLDSTQLNDAFVFLRICQQPSRWPVMEKLAKHMLALKGLDPEYRMMLHSWHMESVAQQGRADEALKMVDAALKDVGDLRTLRARIKLQAANITRDFMKDYQAAGQMYV